MKKHIYILLLSLAPIFLTAQTKDYKVVFDLTSNDTVDQKNVLRWIGEIGKQDPGAQLEVVFYGQSLDLVVKDKSVAPDVITKMAANKNLSFKVCSIAMKRHNIDNSQLIAGVQTVPDGIYEIISRQKEGWGYIKASH
ncbi:MAG: DsrE family protein [Ginsengibacter sp.]